MNILSILTMLACTVILELHADLTNRWILPSTIIKNAHDPILKATRDGAILVWRFEGIGADSVQVSSLRQERSWSRPETLYYADGAQPCVESHTNGDQVSVWVGSDGSNQVIYATRRCPLGEWCLPKIISKTGCDSWNPKIAMTKDGVVAIWESREENGNRIYASQSPSGNNWWSPTALSPEKCNCSGPSLAADDSGKAIVLWTCEDGNKRIQAASLLSGNRWICCIDLSEPSIDSFEAQIACNRKGQWLATWLSCDGTNAFVHCARTTPFQEWETSIVVKSESSNLGSLKAALDDIGNVFVVWHSIESAGKCTIQGVVGTSDNVWTHPIAISEVCSCSHYLQLGVDHCGNAIAIWQNDYEDVSEVQTSSFHKKKYAWSDPVVLAKGELNPAISSIDQLQLIVLSKQKILAVWQKYDEANVYLEWALRLGAF
jgi:hypothetical protein